MLEYHAISLKDGRLLADEIKRWSTNGVAQRKRLDYFAGALSDAIYPLGVDRADPRTFQAEVSSANLGSIRVCKTIGSPHQSYRGRSELARTNDHIFNLLMTMQATWSADHRGSLHLSPRDVRSSIRIIPSKPI
jgi:hypothetical protein